MNAYSEPEHPATYEEKIKRSVFIANVSACHDDNEARNFLTGIASQHRDATHNCRAYVLADGTEYSSDDGEPSGTAGRPILNAIRRAQLVNVIVVVTRYYGGVKLGVRGLIDAYGGVAAKALDLAGRVECIITKKLTVSLGYAEVGRVTRMLEGVGALGIVWDYGESVSVNAQVPVNECERLTGELEELSARGIIAEWEML